MGEEVIFEPPVSARSVEQLKSGRGLQVGEARFKELNVLLFKYELRIFQASLLQMRVDLLAAGQATDDIFKLVDLDLLASDPFLVLITSLSALGDYIENLRKDA